MYGQIEYRLNEAQNHFILETTYKVLIDTIFFYMFLLLFKDNRNPILT